MLSVTKSKLFSPGNHDSNSVQLILSWAAAASIYSFYYPSSPVFLKVGVSHFLFMPQWTNHRMAQAELLPRQSFPSHGSSPAWSSTPLPQSPPPPPRHLLWGSSLQTRTETSPEEQAMAQFSLILISNGNQPWRRERYGSRGLLTAQRVLLYVTEHSSAPPRVPTASSPGDAGIIVRTFCGLIMNFLGRGKYLFQKCASISTTMCEKQKLSSHQWSSDVWQLFFLNKILKTFGPI